MLPAEDSTPRRAVPPIRPVTTAIPPRSSSTIPSASPLPTVPLAFTQKSQPPIPFDRPLPALPLPNNARRHPEIPTGIVVTPSSPRRPIIESSGNTRSNDETQQIERDRARSRSRSTSTSRTRTKDSGDATTPIGLGRPSSAPGTPKLDYTPPPPVPDKLQTVSSPVSSRSGSPGPKISFDEPDRQEDAQPHGHHSVSDESKKTRMKRARSLSGFIESHAASFCVSGCPKQPRSDR